MAHGKTNIKLWEKRIAGWQASGISQSKYCEQENISYTTFSYWRSCLLKYSEKSQAAASAPAFKEATLKSPIQNESQALSQCITVILSNQTKIEIPIGLSQPELSTIFQMLGGLS
jgi:hypothetical protein